MDKNLIMLSIVGNGMPELPLLAQEVTRFKKSETTIAAVKEVAKKLKTKIEKVLELAEKANLYLFHKVVHMQYENYMIFYNFIQGLPKKITGQKAARLLMMYQVMQVDDLTQLLDIYVDMQEKIDRKVQSVSTTKTSLKDLFAEDTDLQDFVERNYNEDYSSKRDLAFEKIMDSLYVWQDGAGWVPRSMMVPKIPILLPGEERKKFKK